MFKYLSAQLPFAFQRRSTRRDAGVVLRLVLILLTLIVIYSVVFHFIMEWENRALGTDHNYSWITGFYWTLVVMTTLGFGDITFASDVGRLFSMLVLLTGVIFLLILLPFAFIQFLYLPWVEAQAAARTPRTLPETTRGHIVLTRDDAVSRALIARLKQRGLPHVLIVPDLDEATLLHDVGIRVMVADLDSPETYHKARLNHAAMLVTTSSDTSNASIAFNARDAAPDASIVATAGEEVSVPVLNVAGCTHVLRLGEMLGQALARRTIGGDAMTHEIGRLDDLVIAEASCVRTPLVGKTLRENQLNQLGVNVIGVWDRGRFQPAGPDTRIGPNTILVLAGTQQQLVSYDEHFAIYNAAAGPAIVIGAGRVGSAAARALESRDVPFRVIEKSRARARGADVLIGNAANEELLVEAGIREAPSALITTADDSVNIYLTLMIRHLRPDIQIVSRSIQDHTVDTLHRAGADFVVSEASMGASVILNLLDRNDLLMLAEGLDITRLPVPKSLAGKTLQETDIRSATGCSVIGVTFNGQTEINPGPSTQLHEGAELLLIGSAEAEREFLERYGMV